jgi:hypothetical protein
MRPIAAFHPRFTTSRFFGRTNQKVPLLMAILRDGIAETRALLFDFSYTKSGSPEAGQHVGNQQNPSKFQTCGLFATMTLAIDNCRC